MFLDIKIICAYQFIPAEPSEPALAVLFLGPNRSASCEKLGQRHCGRHFALSLYCLSLSKCVDRAHINIMANNIDIDSPVSVIVATAFGFADDSCG